MAIIEQDSNQKTQGIVDKSSDVNSVNTMDISKGTIFVLIILTLAISVLGTLTVLHEASIRSFNNDVSSTSGASNVKFGIIDPNSNTLNKHTAAAIVLSIEKYQ